MCLVIALCHWLTKYRNRVSRRDRSRGTGESLSHICMRNANSAAQVASSSASSLVLGMAGSVSNFGVCSTIREPLSRLKWGAAARAQRDYGFFVGTHTNCAQMLSERPGAPAAGSSAWLAASTQDFMSSNVPTINGCHNGSGPVAIPNDTRISATFISFAD